MVSKYITMVIVAVASFCLEPALADNQQLIIESQRKQAAIKQARESCEQWRALAKKDKYTYKSESSSTMRSAACTRYKNLLLGR